MSNQIDDSEWSEDYDRLIEIMKLGSVVCTIEFKFNQSDTFSARDVAKTSYDQKRGTYEISVRGYSYLMAWNEQAFLNACNKNRVRFLDFDKN
jgi:hypothetical protein